MSYGTKPIDNSEDIIDSRDVIKRIEELEGDREALSDAVKEAQETLDASTDDADRMSCQITLKEAQDELTEWDESDEAEELKALKELAEKMDNECEWESGTALIRESYFEDYARELAKDIGAITGDETWPATCIDWEQAARELKMDYSTVTWGDVDYYYRN